MRKIETELEGVFILEPRVFADERGYFMESYSETTYKELGLNFNLIQDNHSFSAEAGTLRGLHYQTDPKAQTKIVRVIGGSAFDVAVDIRKGSPTYGKWISVLLSEENKRQVIIPRGFAHGIQTLTPNTHILYKCDGFYAPDCYHGISWDDSELNIDWPIKTPELSNQDQNFPTIDKAVNNFIYKQQGAS